MSVGDKWEISFAAPIPNYRFTEWPPTPADGPIGWEVPQTSGYTITVRPWPYVGTPGPNASCLFVSSTTGRYLQSALPARSIPPYAINWQYSFVYKCEQTIYSDLYWYDFGGGSFGTNTYTRDAGGWAFYQPTGGTISSASSVRVRFWSSPSGTLWLAGAMLRWKPNDWAAQIAYTTLDSRPLVSGLYYGPLAGAGDIARMNDGTRLVTGLGTRPEKWVLRAEYSDLEEADYLALQRYWMGSRGMLDGFPRPVAIRPYLTDIASQWAPEIIVGHFAEFSFSPKSLGGTWTGSFTLEED